MLLILQILGIPIWIKTKIRTMSCFCRTIRTMLWRCCVFSNTSGLVCYAVVIYVKLVENNIVDFGDNFGLTFPRRPAERFKRIGPDYISRFHLFTTAFAIIWVQPSARLIVKVKSKNYFYHACGEWHSKTPHKEMKNAKKRPKISSRNASLT